MGGRSSSKAVSNTSAQDRRIVADAGGIGVNADNSAVTITATDHGAIDGALDLGKDALSWAIGTVGSTAETFTKASAQTTDRALDSADEAIKLAVGFADKQAARADASAKGAAELVNQAFTTANDLQAGNRTLALGVLAVAGVVGFMALKKG